MFAINNSKKNPKFILLKRIFSKLQKNVFVDLKITKNITLAYLSPVIVLPAVKAVLV